MNSRNKYFYIFAYHIVVPISVAELITPGDSKTVQWYFRENTASNNTNWKCLDGLNYCTKNQEKNNHFIILSKDGPKIENPELHDLHNQKKLSMFFL